MDVVGGLGTEARRAVEKPAASSSGSNWPCSRNSWSRLSNILSIIAGAFHYMPVSVWQSGHLCNWYTYAGWRRGSVVRASVFDWRTFPGMRLIYDWRVTTSWVRRPLWVNQPGQLSLLPSVGRGMSSLSVARWVKLLVAVSPSSEYLYEGKADVVYLQVPVTLCDPHLSA